MRILIIDNYDSFTYNLCDYLLQAQVQCTVLRNDAFTPEDLEMWPFDAILISPGPKRPADAGQMMAALAHWYDRVPILGICLGHQALGTFFGARLIKANQPMHGKTSVIRHEEHPLFAGIPTDFTVMRYHSLLLESLHGTPLDCIAQTATGEIMALTHRTLPLVGIQFHPESIQTEYGLQLIKNWVAGIKN